MSKENIGWGEVTKQMFPSLKTDIRCKWLIVGGGIAGLSAAYFLLEEGETDIVLIEKNTIGSGSTGHSAGMLVYEAEHDWWPHYIKTYGKNLTQHYFNTQQEALALVRKLIIDNNISCGYESGDLLFLGDTTFEVKRILSDFVARNTLNRASTLFQKETLSEPLKRQKYRIAEMAQGEVSVNPLLFARGFATHLKKRGVRIFEHTECTAITQTTITTKSASIQCEKFFLCRGVSEPNQKLKKFLTTIGLTRPLLKSEIKELGLHGAKMFIDDESGSFYYGKITRDKRLMLGFGDVKFSPKKHISGYIHGPHVKIIEAHLKKYTPHFLPFAFTWSAPYALSTLDLPLVTIEPNAALINGGGTQSTTIVASGYAVATLLKKKHPLSKLFEAK